VDDLSLNDDASSTGDTPALPAVEPWVLTASQRVVAEQILAFYDKHDPDAELTFPGSLSARDRKFAADLAQSLMLTFDHIGTGAPRSPGEARPRPTQPDSSVFRTNGVRACARWQAATPSWSCGAT